MLGLATGATAGGKTAGAAMRQAAYFVGNFNTCNFSQWNGSQGPQASFKVVRQPRVEGRCAAALKVGPWARGGLLNPQADGAAWYLKPARYGTDGHSLWQHFSIRFAAGFRATPGEWNMFIEWHNDSGYRNFPEVANEYANLMWTVRTPPDIKRGTRIGMRIIGGVSTAPRTVRVNGPFLRTEHWYDFLAHTVWSPDPSKGLVEWWLDGKRLYSQHVATLYTRPDRTVSTVYFIEDNYRAHASWDSTIYFDGTRLGPTRRSVRY